MEFPETSTGLEQTKNGKKQATSEARNYFSAPFDKATT
jgi:hypothetical protein